jgi:hypothetical protein
MTAAHAAEVESFSSVTAIVFAVISLAIYMLFLRPTTTAVVTTAAAAGTAAAGTRTAAQRQANTPRQQQLLAARAAAAATPRNNNIPPNANSFPADNHHHHPQRNNNNNPRGTGGTGGLSQQQLYLSEAAAEILIANRSTPPHVSTSSAEKVGIGGTSILMDGMVAFSHTRAFAVSQTNKSSDPTVRQDRAKILSRILSSSSASGMITQPPPSKGSTVVIALKQSDLLLSSSSSSSSSQQNSSSLSRSLYLLATYCNLLVVLHVEQNTTNVVVDKEALLSQWRTENVLSEQVLPSHRILLSSSTTGRIALVRQLSNNRVGLVVDWDPDVKTQLERFGYKVALVDDMHRLLLE